MKAEKSHRASYAAHVDRRGLTKGAMVGQATEKLKSGNGLYDEGGRPSGKHERSKRASYEGTPRRRDGDFIFSTQTAQCTLAAIAPLAFEVIPQDTACVEYRQGDALGDEHKHWFRAKFLEQYRRQ